MREPAHEIGGNVLDPVDVPEDRIVAEDTDDLVVGFTLVDPNAPMPKECHLVVRGAEIPGRVTSCAWSPVLEKVIGLAYVAPDQADMGSEFDIKVEGGRLVKAVVVPLPFYDPDNQRQAL